MDISALVPAGLQNSLDQSVISPNYNKLSENLRKLTPISIQCAFFCGGSNCKYENSKAWLPVHMAIEGIFSHWVTDDILAMARPSTARIIQKNIIEQFKELSIKTIINLQTPGEHGSCGGPLDQSGFTYDPSEFMKNKIYFYNFAWKDYGDATTSKILDMVKVVAFSIQEGRVAIHCHAGLGRTGVLIACYLIYNYRCRSSDVIRYVRMKRPGAIQTRGQIKCIQDFEYFILPQITIFPINKIGIGKRLCCLKSYIKKQWNTQHGYEQRTFKYLPKIVVIICERILELCDCREDNSPAEINYLNYEYPFTNKFISNSLDILLERDETMRHSFSWTESLSELSCDFSTLEDCVVDEVLDDGIHDQKLCENNCYKEIQSHLNFKFVMQDDKFNFINIDETIKALLYDHDKLTDEKKIYLQSYQMDLNNKSTTWQRLELETDIYILSGLLYEWLETLKQPVLDVASLSQIVTRSSKPKQCLQKLEPCSRYLIEYLLRFISRLRPISIDTQNLIIKRIIASITHQKIRIRQTLMPSGKNFQKLRGGTTGKLIDFLTRFLYLIQETNTQELSHRTWFSSSGWSIASGRLHDIKDDDNTSLHM
ncbi:protein tyrosine phosphatase domain-containing protein 1-like isoform X2 [Aphidius gifuensis]|uniref:protein tyrosine phosphatase domain-containing protein 1-like isoform X2 n=1 Tax=Aphidius gifuensis TaxID=684658 RepID=UPI001CDC60FB|nr:protein tyrosine phosphatase domain-containing protein 1-like isoform X2 [Aphidius gifuensis]